MNKSMNLTDLKIGTQLKIAFGIIVLLITILGAISYQQADKLAQQTKDLYLHPLTVRQAIDELKADILTMQLEFRNLLLANDEKGKQNAMQTTEIAQVDATKQFDILYDRYLGPRSDIDKAHNAFVRWVTVRTGNREIVYNGKISETMSLLEDTGDIGIVRQQLMDAINVIDDFAVDKSIKFYANAEALKNALNNQLAFLVAFILLLTVLITYFLNRSIRRPIDELTEVTRHFREGKMEVRSKYQSANEFGQLSNSYNDLADTIETEMNLNVQAAKLAGVMLSEDDAHKFSHALLSSLLEQTNSQMGAVYFLNDKKTEFERFECLGMDSEGCKPFSAVHFEGEFGVALSTQKLNHITTIPEDTRFSFHTVSGKFVPREIITIPIVSGNETVAVISLATIRSFTKKNIRLINTILSTLSARMGGILAYRKMIDFSLQLEQQNIELQTQREEMHILNKELTHRSETLSEANSELIAQKRELSAQASELTEQNVELEMQKKQLDESNRLKTSFLSNMSHELRTPLNSVIALSGVLNRRLSGKLPDEEYSYLNVIERNGKQLLSLINDILDLSRIEAGREDVEINRFSIRELVNEVVEMIEPQANQKNISLHYITAKELTPIKSDYIKCRHILQNIVANAVKFTEEGGVEIIAEEMAESIRITVSDTGIGIDREHVPHIFDEFRQADGSNSRKYGGTGLGLAIAKKYAEMLDGRIEVESTPGKGSKFMLILPIQYRSVHTKIEDYVDHMNQTKSSFNGEMNASGKTILLVEDTDAVIIQMKEILVQQGYNILVARNGNEALDQIEHQIPDAMILDLMMPEVDGFEVLKRIRNEEKTDHLPVIILTAKYVTKEELAFLKSNSIYQLIQKGDINKDQLLNTVAQMIFPEAVKVDVPATKPPRIPISGTPLVLIVEDNPDNMTTIKALLDGKCQIIEAEDGRTGVEMARKHQPHLILMDIALPGMNGIEALIEIRNDEKLEFVPIIAVSASAMKGDREDFIALGFDSYISKPIDNKVFKAIIAEYLN
jgi:signal transduction histidine kinase/CheY-like chemotaxis protein/HAMP domain-containing protein